MTETNGLKPRKATRATQYIVYSFKCPWCDNDSIENPDTGSVDWKGEELLNYIAKHGHIVNCDYCSNPVKI